MKIAIQGIATSFHEMAAHQYFGENIIPMECMTFQKLCESIKNEASDFGVMAIENSIAGSLLQNYSLLMQYEFYIIGEIYLNIQMNLMALPGQSIDEIHTVQSHPIALQQCAEFLLSLPQMNSLEVEDTALAAKNIADNNKMGTAAIANTMAAGKYGLEILKSRIETNKQNFTRFLIVSKKNKIIEDANKASLCIQLKHEKGSLLKILSVFNDFDINLTKIQSVPIIGKPYEYSFHIDVEWNDYNKYLLSVEKIRCHSNSLLIMGEYKKGKFELQL